jgi:hypothetical protein
VGEAVRWSADRQTAWRMLDGGEHEGEISLGEARELAPAAAGCALTEHQRHTRNITWCGEERHWNPARRRFFPGSASKQAPHPGDADGLA